MKKLLLFVAIILSLTLYAGLLPEKAYATHTYNHRMITGTGPLSYCNGNNILVLSEGPDSFFGYYGNYDTDPNQSPPPTCKMVTYGINTADGTTGSAYTSAPTLAWKSNFQSAASTGYTIKFWMEKIFFWQDSTGGLIDISDGKVNPNTGQPFNTMELDCNGGNHSTDPKCGFQTSIQGTPYVLNVGGQFLQNQVLTMSIPSSDFSGSFTSGQIPGTPPSTPCNLNKNQGYFQLDYDVYYDTDLVNKIGGGFNFIRISGSLCSPPTSPTPIVPTVTPGPTINPQALDLIVKGNTSDNPSALDDSQPGPTRGISGLRSDDPNIMGRGNNYFNSLTITAKVKPGYGIANSDISLLGAAFVSKDSSGSSPSNQVLQNLMIRANKNTGQGDGDNGFIMVYAAKDVDVPYVPQQSCGGFGGGSHSFCQSNYYLYFKGTWSPPSSQGFVFDKSAQGLKVRADGRADPINPTPNPEFNVWLYQPLGNQTWDTVVYVMTQNTDQLRDFTIPLTQ